jgi:fatty acid desaturase
MRSRAAEFVNAVAWALILILAAFAILVAHLLGFVGLLILGLLTWLICTDLELRDATPACSIAVFRALMESSRAPEQSAAEQAERRARLSVLPFYRWCGIALTIIGATGFLWQRWIQE